MKTTHRAPCKIGACEPYCGLEIDVEDGRLVEVRPDPEHPISEGYVCLKGMRVPDVQNDPDRLLYPHKGVGSGRERVSWRDATREIGGKLRALRDEFGPQAIATYWGNACDSIAITMTNTFCSALGSPNSFNVLSLEYTDRGAVAERMFGDENFILQPDAKHASYALLLGTNPLVTQGMTLLQRRPHVGRDLQGIRRRGGRVVVVDPRRTETAKIASEHIGIVPGTDLYFLLGLAKSIVASELYDKGFVAQHTRGFASLVELLARVDLDQVGAVTGVPKEVIERNARELATADGAFVTTRVGVQTSHNTTLTEWMVQTLNAITGNVDRRGGVYFNPGAVDVPGLIRKFTKRKNPAPSRVGGFPQIFGGPPASTFADDVLSDDPQRIRALVVVGGNPVISFPNTAKMERALSRLDLLVSIDLYVSDTGAFAHYNLPAASTYEKGGVHFLTSTFEPYPYAEYKPKLVEPPGEARGEWQTFRALSRAAGVPFLNNPSLSALDRALGALGSGLTPEHLYRYVLWNKTSPKKLRRVAGGIKLGDIEWGKFLATRLATPTRKIELFHEDLGDELARQLSPPARVDTEFPLLLISGGRRAAGFNSWTHNIPSLMKKLNGNFATVNDGDAARLNIATGDRVRVSSATGTIEIGAVVSKNIVPGVVMIHQFWGHHYESGMHTSRQTPGVNVNHLHDDGVRDHFTGMPVYNGTPCRVEAIR